MIDADAAIAGALELDPQRLRAAVSTDLDTQLRALDRSRPYRHLGTLGDALEAATSQAAFPALAEGLLRLVLARALAAEHWRPTVAVPASVRAEVETQRARIATALTLPDRRFGPRPDDFFRKELGLLTGALLPVGDGLVDTDVPLQRAPLRSERPLQRLRFLTLLLRPPAGTGRFLQAHLHKPLLARFGREERLRTLERTAELLEANPQHKGYTSASWLGDPRLEEISPELHAMTRDPILFGARRFYLHPDASGNALSRSPTRQRLHAEGRYRPRVYLTVWHRADMLAWLAHRRETRDRG